MGIGSWSNRTAPRLFINDNFDAQSHGAARKTLIGERYSRQIPAPPLMSTRLVPATAA